MEYNKLKIQNLLYLYEQGKTTLEQEQFLRTYFSSEDYDDEFEAYALLFSYFQNQKEAYIQLENTPKEKTNFSHWFRVVASVCIVLGGLWFYESYTQQQEIEKAKYAFETTQKALNLLSVNMNQGLEKLEYVEVFNEQKNHLLK